MSKYSICVNIEKEEIWKMTKYIKGPDAENEQI